MCEGPHGEEVLRKTSCTSGERLASLVFRLRRTLAPSVLNTRASRSTLALRTRGLFLTDHAESLTKTTMGQAFMAGDINSLEV